VLTEITDQGEQVLVPGVVPVSLRDRLERLLASLNCSSRWKFLVERIGKIKE